MPTRLSLIVLAAFLVSVPVMSSAQILTTVSTSAPTSNVTLSVSSTALNLSWRYNYAADERRIGQTFTPATSFTLDTITLAVYLASAGAPGASYTLTMSTYTNSSTAVPDTTINSWTGTLPTTGMATDTFLTFDIPNLVLNSGNTYGFTLAFTSAATNENVNFYQGTGGLYTGGTAFYYAPSANPTPNNDFYFILTSVPEGSSFSLLLVGLAGLIVWKRLLPRRQPEPASLS